MKGERRRFLGQTVEFQRRLKQNRSAERIVEWVRDHRYLVVYTHSQTGQLLPFGYSSQSDGGAAMYLARLLRWAYNPQVIDRLEQSDSALDFGSLNQKRVANG